MRIKKIRKLMSIVLLFSFMVMEFSSVATVLADERNAKAAERKWMQDAGAGLVDWAGQYKELDENTVPKAVGYENAKWKNHIERLYDEEGKDLNRVVFKNADGTRTQYVFDYPVKYKDKDGKIKDSSLKIKENNSGKYKFETEAGISTAMFPNSMQEGIVLEGNDTQIRMVLHNVKSDHPKRLDEETISYKYDAHTTVEYSLTYTGFKEDIVVHKYTGQTEYDFTVYTGGLELKEVDGSFYIVDENGEEKATIGDIIIFTADEKNNTLGELRAIEVVKNQEYRLTIVLDPEYLAAPETVYPIRIDPTIEITYDNNGAGAIEDVTINSLKGSSGSSKSLSVGLRENYGISRILMKFPGLDLSRIGAHTRITNATVELRDLLCEGTYLTVSCYAFAGNEWTESTANWSNVSPNSISTFLSSQTISYYNGVKLSPKHRYSFDITEVVKGWKTGNYNQDKGIIFRVDPSVENGSTYDCRTIASYNRSSNKPTLTVTYDSSPSSYQLITDGTYYLNSKYSGYYLRKSSSTAVISKNGLLQTLGNSIQWEIRNVDGGYVIYSTADKTKYLGMSSSTTSPSVELVTISDNTIPKRCIWTITMASNGSGYLIKNNYNSRYLYTYGGTIYTTTSVDSLGSAYYNTAIWRVANTSLTELSSSASIAEMVINIGETVSPVITKKPSNAYWATITDFYYSYVSGTSGCVSFDSSTGKATGVKPGIATYQAKHKVTGQTYTFKVYVDRYMYELVKTFEFADDDAMLIRSCYDRMRAAYPSENDIMISWRYSRLMGGLHYDNSDFITKFKWTDVAGDLIGILGSEKSYCISALKLSEAEYSQLSSVVKKQHDDSNKNGFSDFAHFQISLAARLAYYLGKDGPVSNIYGSSEKVSYLAGWLGDATIKPVVFKNDDYQADLDSENLYWRIVGGGNYLSALSEYYECLSVENTRADEFLSHISYEYAKQQILAELNCNMDTLQTTYPDSYAFLTCLEDRNAEMETED